MCFSVLLFSMNKEGLAKQVLRRVVQCVLTSPTAACFSTIETDDKRLVTIGYGGIEQRG